MHPQDVLHLIGVSVVEQRRAVIGLRYPRLGARQDERAQELGDPSLVQRDPHHLELGRVPAITKLLQEGVNPRREELRPELLARQGNKRALSVGILGAVVPREEVGKVDRLVEEIREPRELREGLRLVTWYDVVVRKDGLFVSRLELLERPEVTIRVLRIIAVSLFSPCRCLIVIESALKPIVPVRHRTTLGTHLEEHPLLHARPRVLLDHVVSRQYVLRRSVGVWPYPLDPPGPEALVLLVERRRGLVPHSGQRRRPEEPLRRPCPSSYESNEGRHDVLGPCKMCQIVRGRLTNKLTCDKRSKGFQARFSLGNKLW